jgi:predicted GNAT family acetyltransferase
MIVVQAPVYVAQVAQALVEQSDLAISGIAGPATQVEATKQALGLGNKATQIDEKEILFSLKLQDLQVPPALASGAVQCRLPHTEELELLSEWSVAYNVETLGRLATPDLLPHCRLEIEARQSTAKHWVLIVNNTPVAYTAFNARLPDIVQIGGVWTPPALRGNGYAKCVVAGSLLDAKSQGVERAVLFTNQENYAAQAVYRVIGFQNTGEKLGLVLFQDSN